MKLIDKDKIAAEIEKEVKNIYAGREYVGIHYDEECMVRGLQKAEDIIDTLEVKEVDLEKEIKEEYLKRRCYGGKDNILVVLNEPQFNKIAKHFFELGVQQSKNDNSNDEKK
jgi:hypothetical protein